MTQRIFEWDDEKERANLRKHGIGFSLAARIFDGPVVTGFDDREDYGEVREVSVGMVDGVAVLVVVHTDRAGKTRIISARPATKRERRRYEEACDGSFGF
jgi:uncharacterized DUF497 family protein